MKFAFVVAVLAAGNVMAEAKKDSIGTHSCRDVLSYETSPTARAAVDSFVAAAILAKTTSSFTQTQDGGINFTSVLPTTDKINEITRSSDFPVIMGMLQTWCAESPDEQLQGAVANVVGQFFRWR